MVSVVVPVFNVEPFINQCIDSILSQSYSNLEIILIDDGSTDKSGDICDSYKDSRITVYHTENRGLSAARNMGIDRSHGEYVLFVDSDDWIEPNLIELVVGKIGDADILCFGEKQNNYNGFEAMCALINGDINKAVWNKLYRKECFESVRFPEGQVMEEVATTYKFFINSQIVKCSDICGYHYRIRSGSITQTHDMKNIVDCWKAYKDRYEYCASIVDSKTYENPLKSCAEAIIHAWVWRNENNTSESYIWNEMSEFARKMFPSDIKKQFPIVIRGGLFLARFNNDASFWMAYRINQIIRKLKSLKNC